MSSRCQKLQTLVVHLLPDAVNAFGATASLRFLAQLPQRGLQGVDDFIDIVLTVAAFLPATARYGGIPPVRGSERQILQLPLEMADSEAVRQASTSKTSRAMRCWRSTFASRAAWSAQVRSAILISGTRMSAIMDTSMARNFVACCAGSAPAPADRNCCAARR